MNLVPRFSQTPNQSFFLFGPRGVGKSTLLRQRMPDALFVDLLDPATHRSLGATPEHLREMVAGSQAQTVVVDEVQRVPELLSVVHALLEAPNPPRFVLTASSARKLRRGGVDLLAGRALNCSLHPFMAAELSNFDLAQALEIGLLPLVLGAAFQDDTLAAYAGLYLDQDVRSEGLTRNVGNFARFLEAISFSHGRSLKVASVARDCEVSHSAATDYVDILEDLLLAFRLRLFRKRPGRAVTGRDKIYLFDTGVFRSLRPKGPLESGVKMEHQALNGLVAQHLKAWTSYSRPSAELFFWRTRGGAEVDFVVHGEVGLIAIKLQNALRIRRTDLRSLRSFRADYPEATAIALYRGSERLRIDDVWCLPVEDFLRNMRPDHALLPTEGNEDGVP